MNDIVLALCSFDMDNNVKKQKGMGQSHDVQ
jgi:hypothetical protein